MATAAKSTRATASKSVQARLNFRLPGELKSLIESAAASSGQSVSNFALAALARSARDVVEQEQVTRLSLRDAKRFLEIIDRTDAKPSRALKAAAKDYLKRVREK